MQTFCTFTRDYILLFYVFILNLPCLIFLVPFKCFPLTPLIKYSQYLNIFTLIKIFMPDMKVTIIKHYQTKQNNSKYTYACLILTKSLFCVGPWWVLKISTREAPPHYLRLEVRMPGIWFLCLLLSLILVNVQSNVNLLWPAANNKDDSKAPPRWMCPWQLLRLRQT